MRRWLEYCHISGLIRTIEANRGIHNHNHNLPQPSQFILLWDTQQVMMDRKPSGLVWITHAVLKSHTHTVVKLLSSLLSCDKMDPFKTAVSSHNGVSGKAQPTLNFVHSWATDNAAGADEITDSHEYTARSHSLRAASHSTGAESQTKVAARRYIGELAPLNPKSHAASAALSTKLLRLLTRQSTLVYRSTYMIFFTTTSQQGLCIHQPPTSCSILHSSVRSLTGRSRLQHLPFGTLCRHQLDPLTLLVLLNLDLKLICLRQHISPRTVQRYRSASGSHATRAGAIEICIDIDIQDCHQAMTKFFTLSSHVHFISQKICTEIDVHLISSSHSTSSTRCVSNWWACPSHQIIWHQAKGNEAL